MWRTDGLARGCSGEGTETGMNPAHTVLKTRYVWFGLHTV